MHTLIYLIIANRLQSHLTETVYVYPIDPEIIPMSTEKKKTQGGGSCCWRVQEILNV